MQKKFQNKFKLTPEVYKNLKQVAIKLPAFKKKDKNGNLLWREISKFNGTKNFSFNQKSYTKLIQKGKEPLLVNHEVNLCDIYQKDGQAGVDKYVDFFTVQIQKHTEVEKKETEKVIS